MLMICRGFYFWFPPNAAAALSLAAINAGVGCGGGDANLQPLLGIAVVRIRAVDSGQRDRVGAGLAVLSRANQTAA